MGDITIRIPQKVHIEYTLKSAQLTKRVLDKLSDISSEQPRLGDLALKLFGADTGVELDLPQHAPHQTLEFDQ